MRKAHGLFAQRRNLVRPAFYRMLRDIMRFNRESLEVLEDGTSRDQTVDEYLANREFSRQFVEHYLLPMGSAIWSCPPTTFLQFPIRFIVEFYRNHGLLNIRNRPAWRVIEGGSQRYVDVIRKRFTGQIRLQTPIKSAVRFDDRVDLTDGSGDVESFDEVVFACHSDQALKILNDASSAERDLLTAFPYEPNTAVLHTDTAVLPKRKRAWAAWNYRIRSRDTGKTTVTYNMNILQHINSHHVFCVTLNDVDGINEAKVIRKIRYAHPIFTTRRSSAQRRHKEVIRSNRTSFCGAYWGYGFHEDGVNSALSVCEAFERRPVLLPTAVNSQGADDA